MEGLGSNGKVETVREAVPAQYHVLDDPGFCDRKAKWKPHSYNEVDHSEDDQDYSENLDNHKHKKKHHKEKHGKKKRKHAEHREMHKPKHKGAKAPKPKKQKRQTKLADNQLEESAVRRDRESLKRKRHAAPVLRQCLGPSCVKVARTGSKYCSDECGLKLAEMRIKRWLPERYAASRWDVEPVASRRDATQLEEIRTEKEQIRTRLENLAERRRELDELIERASSMQHDNGQRNDEEEDCSQIYCVVCGHEVQTLRALKHFERCFTKAESRTMFGSFEKARADAQDVFCDEYNPKLRTYCKRLKVLCPEHSHKLDKEDRDRLDNVPCGFPLMRRERADGAPETHRPLFTVHAEDFSVKLIEARSEDVLFCNESKATCSRHYSWDRLRKAQIDMERVRLWMRIEELHELERRVNAQLAQRRNLLGVLLHTTIDHSANAATNDACQPN